MTLQHLVISTMISALALAAIGLGTDSGDALNLLPMAWAKGLPLPGPTHDGLTLASFNRGGGALWTAVLIVVAIPLMGALIGGVLSVREGIKKIRAGKGAEVGTWVLIGLGLLIIIPVSMWLFTFLSPMLRPIHFLLLGGGVVAAGLGRWAFVDHRRRHAPPTAAMRSGGAPARSAEVAPGAAKGKGKWLAIGVAGALVLGLILLFPIHYVVDGGNLDALGLSRRTLIRLVRFIQAVALLLFVSLGVWMMLRGTRRSAGKWEAALDEDEAAYGAPKHRWPAWLIGGVIVAVLLSLLLFFLPPRPDRTTLYLMGLSSQKFAWLIRAIAVALPVGAGIVVWLTRPSSARGDTARDGGEEEPLSDAPPPSDNQAWWR